MNAYVPPQHGAWAFLGLPLVLGSLTAPWSPLLPALALAWISAYPLSYAALGLVRARHPQRFRRPLMVWLTVVVPLAVLLVVWRPWLVWVGLAFAGLFGVNLAYARANRERALVNDLVFIVECVAMVWVVWAVAAGDGGWHPPAAAATPRSVYVLTAFCALVLTGSTMHVKSLIRERRNPRFSVASRVVAVGSVVIGAGLAAAWGSRRGLWLVVPLAALAVRAQVVGRKPLRPGRIGLVELACFLLASACAAAA